MAFMGSPKGGSSYNQSQEETSLLESVSPQRNSLANDPPANNQSLDYSRISSPVSPNLSPIDRLISMECGPI